MTSRDTYDINKYASESGHNVQIKDVIGMMASSEPELFGQSSAILVKAKVYEPSESVKMAFLRMVECAKLLAQEDKRYWDEIFSE